MAKFSVTLYEIGDHVQVTDGDFKGLKGKVADWGRIGSHGDIDMIIALDEPYDHIAKTETKMADGAVVTRSETVVLTRVDVKTSQLSAA